MEKILKRLDVYNQEIWEARQEARMAMLKECSKPNGIACPNCGKELVDSIIAPTIFDEPGTQRIVCLAGDYHGIRLV